MPIQKKSKYKNVDAKRFWRKTKLALPQKAYIGTVNHLVGMAPQDTEPDDVDMKEVRRRNPSGWLELSDGEGLPFVIDALLDAHPGRGFNKTELGDRAGFTRETVRSYIDRLVELGVVEEVPDTDPQRYRLNEDGRVTQEIFDLNSAVNAVRAGQDQEISRSTPNINMTPLEEASQQETIRQVNRLAAEQYSDTDQVEGLNLAD